MSRKTALGIVGFVGISAAIVTIANEFRASNAESQAIMNAESKALRVIDVFWNTCGAHLSNFKSVQDTLVNLDFVEKDVGWKSDDGWVIVDTNFQNGIAICTVSHLGGGMSTEGTVFQRLLREKIAASFQAQGIVKYTLTSSEPDIQYLIATEDGDVHVSTVQPIVTSFGGLMALSM